jgi:LysR family transcriptional regulator, glycine cleavage system transcriptional activator
MNDPLSHLSLDALRVFETAARLKSFTRAAEALGMTQAAVSWRIRDLEERLNSPLFIRATRQIHLTDEGERLARACQEALALIRNAVTDITEKDQSVLTITTLQTLATQWLAARIGRFQLANPDLAVRVETGRHLSPLSGDGADIGIRFGSGQYAGLESRLLFPSIFTPLCSPELADKLLLRQPADLKQAPLIGQADEWAAWFEAAGVVPDQPAQHRLLIENQAMEVAAAISGQNVALGSPVLFANEIERGLLVRPFPHHVQLGRGYWLCYPQARRTVSKIARFRDWILEMARQDAAIMEACRLTGAEVGQHG